MPHTDDVAGIPGVPAYTATHLRDPERDIALVIPVINENGRLIRQLDRIKTAAPEVDVMIADGGSTDGSTNGDRHAQDPCDQPLASSLVA